jgi:hypothetical protein
MSIRLLLPLISIITVASITSLACAADSIILKNGNSLSGKLIDSDVSGILTLSYPDAKQPIKIRESSVNQIIFDSSDKKNSTQTESIQLVNGDHFPCTITELNNKVISFTSDSVGNHTISRDKISHVKFNTKANKTLYSGPGNDLSTWLTSSEGWKLKNGKLRVSKVSEAAKMIPNLTENYILEFKTTWEESAPHLRICFSSDRSSGDKQSSYYYINLDSHGLAIYNSQKGVYKTLTQVMPSDKIYGKSSLNVMIYVDRKNQKLALYLNGQFAKNLTDLRTPPSGSYLIIKNRQRDGVITEISDIKVSSWSGKITDDLQSKADSLTKHDLITDLSGSVMTGQIIGISRVAGKVSLDFKAPFAKNNSKIPSSAIDLLEFQTNPESPNLLDQNYHLNLVSGGIISFSSSQMTNGKFIIDHPILGNISLPTTRLSSMIIIPELSKKSMDK